MEPSLTPVAELGWSSDLRVDGAEGACVALFGRPASELVGRALHEVLGIAPDEAQALDRQARAPAGAVEFLTVHGPGGEARTLRLGLSSDGARARASALDLDAALVGAPPVQISRLSSSLSHELRNPLSSVKMAVQTLAKNTTLGERDQRRLRIANREIRTIERMLSLLSEYGRISHAAVEGLPMRQVVAEAAALVEPELAERQIHLDIREPTDCGKVRADLTRLRPVLAQLLLNVASGLAAGAALIVSLRPEGRHAEVVVADPTAALPPEEKATLFEPFGSRLARGAGLSLAALKRAMTSQGGTVSVEERDGGGMEFRLRFACA